jgi:hypothetical protein
METEEGAAAAATTTQIVDVSSLYVQLVVMWLRQRNLGPESVFEKR